jgi:hypothetical protein
MNYSKLKDSAELIGIAAIVASLIFVGLQMKQSQEIAIATQYHARAEAVMNMHLAGLEADWLGVPALRAGISDDISARDINQSLWLWIVFDNHFYQYQAGFLAEDSWQGQWRNITDLYSACGMRFVWDWRKTGLRAQFVSLVESIDDPCQGELQQ